MLLPSYIICLLSSNSKIIFNKPDSRKCSKAYPEIHKSIISSAISKDDMQYLPHWLNRFNLGFELNFCLFEIDSGVSKLRI